MIKSHTFHIPVMGIGFTAETPLKVSHYGIDSVISLVDDILLEKLRKKYSEKYQLNYEEIKNNEEDFRARRITSYLNLINSLVEKKFEDLKNAASLSSAEIKKYFSLLPENSSIKKEFDILTSKIKDKTEINNWIKSKLSRGSIDVNIMSKLDKSNYKNDKKLSVEYNDAHAALRGYANSDLNSSLILSAGMNPRLYSYLEKFEDFFPDEEGNIKKKIVLKVSDFRSALIQGKFLAKKGLWVSEYRIESGLNCGGHAFATDGFLIGPILAEFREKKEELAKITWDILKSALSAKNRTQPLKELSFKITAQGGVGTAEEHDFLLQYFNVDSVGWGSPFLLVPEVTAVDNDTLNKLALAEEKDLYLSNISPLGVPFNNLRGNSKDIEKLNLIAKGRPGSSCPKKYIALTEISEGKTLCTASRQYQYEKLKELGENKEEHGNYQMKYDAIVDKSCICVGLGTSALIVNDIETKTEGNGVSVCPGPNIAYFSKVMTLNEITDHIYGRINIVSRTDRPNMFIKELGIYIEYLKNKIDEAKRSESWDQQKYLNTFVTNLKDGANYYSNLFKDLGEKFYDFKSSIVKELEEAKIKLNSLAREINEFFLPDSSETDPEEEKVLISVLKDEVGQESF